MDNLIAVANEDKREPDYDLRSAFEHNPQEDWDVEDIENMIAVVYGEADGPSWYWLVELKEDAMMYQAGPYALLEGGCDYTGWDCQSHLQTMKHGDLDECLEAAPIEDWNGRRVRENLRKQVDNELPFGITSHG